jgi:hypothetical protein
MLKQERQQAQEDLVKSMQSQTQGDMASLMARYGSQLALAGAMAGSSTPAPPAVSRAGIG